MIEQDPRRTNRDDYYAPQPDRPRGRGRGPNFTTIALIGGLVLLALVIAYFASNRDPNQDKLGGNSSATVASASSSTTGEKDCASKATYDLIKRELFRKAAQRRGSDAAAYDRLAAYAVLRMENPVMENDDAAARAVQCSGTMALDLPPGVVIEGNRRTLMSDIDYDVRPAADGSGNVIVLRNAEAIIVPLSTIARAAPVAPAAPTAPSAPAAPAQGVDGTAPPAPTAPASPVSQAPPPVPPRQVARPSFDCGKARTRGEIAVCADSNLAALDRQMASQFNRAIDEADASQRFLLLRTRADFLQFRDSCRSDGCIANAYTGRMREIGDVMSGRWRPR